MVNFNGIINSLKFLWATKMDFIDRKEIFYNRFGIENNVPDETRLNRFKIGIKNFLADIDQRLDNNDVIRYCSLFGFEVTWSYTVHGSNNAKNVFECINSEKDWSVFLHKLQELFYLHIHHNRSPTYNHELFLKIKELMSNSILSIDFIKTNNDYYIIPTGCKFLDNELIIKPLKFLKNESHAHFIQALKFFSENNCKSFIKSAESIRRTLEEYLRQILKNKNGLQKNISEIGKNLKDLNKQKQIKDIFHNYLKYLDDFFNENSKHKDGDISESECELIILQAGLLMKYLDKIHHIFQD